ncbi:M16 family metallopeptidase [Patescibacteria group bacterium]
MQERVVHTLENGFKVVHIPFENIESATFRLFGRAGSLWETDDSLGAAHFLEHVVFEGTKKYPDPDKLKRVVLDVGGSTNAYTSFNQVSFVAKTLKSDMENAFDLLSQLVIDPLINQKEVSKHKKIITQELNRRLDNPLNKFMLNSEKIIFPKGHRRQKPILGTFESIDKTTSSMLKNYLKNNYTANNFVLGVCADVPTKMVTTFAEKYFSEMKKGKQNDFKIITDTNELEVYCEKNKNIIQSTVIINFFAPIQYEKESYPSEYLSTIMGKGFISRINTEIREKRGLAYVTGANYSDANDFGMFNMYAQIDEKNFSKVMAIFKKEIKKVVEKGITKEEFERTRKQIMANFVFSNERPKKRAGINTGLILDGKDKEDYDSLLQKYKNVTIEDVNSIAHKIFKKKPKIKVLSKNIQKEIVIDIWNQH